jgi:hypothetical protein
MATIKSILALTALIATTITFTSSNQANAQGKSPDDKPAFRADTPPPDVVVDTRTEVQILQDFNDTIKKVTHTATDLVKEVNRHAPSPVNQEDILDAVVMDPWGNSQANDPFDPTLTAAMRKGPLLPPRKKWLDLEVARLDQLMDIVKKEIAQLNPPSDAPTGAKDIFKAETASINNNFSSIQNDFQQLQQLIKGPQFDADKIGKAANDIRTNTHAMDESRKRALKAVTKKFL